jgi:hypothetical protein
MNAGVPMRAPVSVTWLDGSPATIADPVTGEAFTWRFVRTYGCNTAVASENLLTFRSGAAGFYDLANHGGTGNFGGFKSGCTSNLIVADGVLSAPDYTRTCTCGYQNQTSLAMVPMPENEIWTYNLFAQPEDGSPEIRGVGINLGAPGDRAADDGTLWVNFPADEGRSPKVIVEANEGADWYRNHSSRIVGGEYPWVAASGGEGIERLTLRLVPPSGFESETTGIEGAAEAQVSVGYTVRLVFAEPDAEVKPGDRVFDVVLQDDVVASGLDVVNKAGGPMRSIVETWKGVPIGEALEIELRKKGKLAPVLCGVEISREQ